MNRVSIVSAAVLLAACGAVGTGATPTTNSSSDSGTGALDGTAPDDGTGTPADTGAGETSQEDSASTADISTSDGATSGEPDASSDGGSTGSGSDSTSSESTGSESTGSDSDQAACEDSCLWDTECDPEFDWEVCMSDCLFNMALFDDMPECDAAMEGLVECMGAFDSCPARLTPECMAFEELLTTECDGCSAVWGGSEDYSSCAVQTECAGVVRELSCDDEVCTCTEDDEVTGQCDAVGVCMDIVGWSMGGGDDPLNEIRLSCCGWEAVDWTQ